ncbi:putative membrane protein [Smittium mucronatum]|uniref:Putative membrane protein n=1 Tax=Smittium mucronatum TaxID=133383 RepID=A0A1R0H409_9FUNG|nr:putative membrane protein [Smittium mucronatum]
MSNDLDQKGLALKSSNDPLIEKDSFPEVKAPIPARSMEAAHFANSIESDPSQVVPKVPLGDIPNLDDYTPPPNFDMDTNTPPPIFVDSEDIKGEDDISSEVNSINLKKNANFHLLFRNIPINELLLEDYVCAFQKDILIQGRLYVTNNYIGFYSNIFGWVTNLCITFDEVVSIEKKNSAIIIPNAIRISTLHRSRVFTSFLYRDSAYDLLIKLWRKSKANSSLDDNPADYFPVGDPRRNSVDSMKPNFTSHVESLNDLEVDSDQEVPEIDQLKRRNSLDLSKQQYLVKLNRINQFLGEARAPISRISEDNSLNNQDPDQDAFHSDPENTSWNDRPNIKSYDHDIHLAHKTPNVLFNSPDPTSRNPNTFDNILLPNDKEKDNKRDPKLRPTSMGSLFNDMSSSFGKPSGNNLDTISVMTSNPKSISDISSTEATLSSNNLLIPKTPTECPCNEQDKNVTGHYKTQVFDGSYPIPPHLLARVLFFGLGYPNASENLKYGFDTTAVDLNEIDYWRSNYLKDMGMKDVDITYWPVGLRKLNYKAHIKYIKPLNFSIGPKKALTLESYKLVLFDLSKAIIVDIHVNTPEVPAGNCFTILIRYCITWQTSNSPTYKSSHYNYQSSGDTFIGFSRLTISFQVEWSKSSWIKGAIESGALESTKSDALYLDQKINEFIETHPQLKTNIIIPSSNPTSMGSQSIHSSEFVNHFNRSYSLKSPESIQEIEDQDPSVTLRKSKSSKVKKNVLDSLGSAMHGNHSFTSFADHKTSPSTQGDNDSNFDSESASINSRNKSRRSSTRGSNNNRGKESYISKGEVEKVDESFLGQLRQPLYKWLSDPSNQSQGSIIQNSVPASLVLVYSIFTLLVLLYSMRDFISSSIPRMGLVVPSTLSRNVPKMTSIYPLISGLTSSTMLLIRTAVFPLTYILNVLINIKTKRPSSDPSNANNYSQEGNTEIKKSNKPNKQSTDETVPNIQIDRLQDQINGLNNRLDAINDLLQRVLQARGDDQNLEQYI